MSEAQVGQVWTIQKLIQWTTEHFASKGIPSARLDAEILLAYVLNCKRLDLYLKFDQPLQEKELKTFKALVIRRAQHEPVAYMTGRQEFYGRPFAVGPGVLIPRPETEHLIDEALSWAKKANVETSWRILDIGSGSGCISVTLAAELPTAHVTAVDSSEAGARFTETNARALGVHDRLRIVRDDFIHFKATEKFDIIVTNPPYIGLQEKEALQPDVVRYEPHEALFGGHEGHEILADWLPKIRELLKPGGLFLCEIGSNQGAVARSLMAEKFKPAETEIIKDYSTHDRLIKAIKPEETARG